MNKLIALAAACAATLSVPALSAPAFAQTMPTGLQGIKIAVADYDRTTRFYSNLGMAAGATYNDHERQLVWVDPAKGVSLVMVHDTSGRMAMTRGGAFIMISVPDVPAAVARLKAAGFAVPGEPKVTPRATIMMLKDPDGNSIELLGGPFGQGAAAPAPHH
ncbi:MAG: VOC family protein [Novosphingobium sp.]